ncbi:uncharacterized protein M2352_004422 [Azospirillum fermentarium]|uniref:lysozyme inhibitor LprI family protein n=1 Tax=Azospirillum fermentarium TaxID=1233114 RepID=UPI0022264489|nr:lysozyme inhibitor LprI family protein [Azospirillum fermentarium]MCW2248762.1 uncharacterized protein [Azospirillum fermentarium]
MYGFLCLLTALFLGIAGLAHAQTYSPSYDCTAVSDAVEVFVCHNRDLSFLDREMSASYRSYIRTLSPSDADLLKKGQIRWIQDRNTRCRTGYGSVDASCIESAYRGRKTALDSLASLPLTPGAWARDGMRWVQVASRSSADDAVEIARSLQHRAPQPEPYLVLLALNGWYAVSSGPYTSSEAAVVLAAIMAAARDSAAEEPIVTRGDRYTLRLYHSQDELPRSVEQPPHVQPPAVQPAVSYRPPSVSHRCAPAEISKRQALCYVALVGETACQSFLETKSESNVILTGGAAAAVCSAASSGLQNGTIDLDAVLGSAFRGALSGIGTAMLHQDNDPITRIIGAFVKFSVVSYDVSMAIDCARAVERQC